MKNINIMKLCAVVLVQTIDNDGADAVHSHMTNSKLTDPEVLEWRFPVLQKSFEIKYGSGGAGKHRGGNGVIRKMQFLEGMTANIIFKSSKGSPIWTCRWKKRTGRGK